MARAQKAAKYALKEPGGYAFTSLGVGIFGRHCKATHELLNKQQHLAKDSDRFSRGARI